MLLIIFEAVFCYSIKQGSIPTRMIASLRSVITYTSHYSKPTYFRHPSLSEEKMKSGCRLGLDYWADTGWSVKHPYVDEFIEGKSVNVTGSTYNLGYIDNLPIAHVLYVFYKEYGTLVFLEQKNTIYMRDNMTNSLSCPIQYEDNDVRIYLHTKVYDPNNNKAHSITFPYLTSISVE